MGTKLTEVEKLIKDGLAADPRKQGQLFCDFMLALTSCKLHDKGDIAQVFAHMASMLAAPVEPKELAAAVDALRTQIDVVHGEPEWFVELHRDHAETLLRHVRAPRITKEQCSVLITAYNNLVLADCPETARMLRAAFAGELGEVEG